MNVGIVGHEAAKFTKATEKKARAFIRHTIESTLLCGPESFIVSGHCHLGGIDIWAEEEAADLGAPFLVFPPKTHRWSDGYMPRNLQIAAHSDVVYCIVVAEYPKGYDGMRFDECYHCHTTDHIKSGGCWTAKRAKKGIWKVIV